MCSLSRNRLSYTFFIMGTRSRIGIQLQDESIVSVYCHWDGYPSFNGRVLREHYTTIEQVRDLIDGGNISSLHTNVGWKNETLPKTGPQYYTSRGESIKENEPRIDDDITEFLDNGEEYAYIFTRADEWICYDLHDISAKLTEIPAGSVTDS